MAKDDDKGFEASTKYLICDNTYADTLSQEFDYRVLYLFKQKDFNFMGISVV